MYRFLDWLFPAFPPLSPRARRWIESELRIPDANPLDVELLAWYCIDADFLEPLNVVERTFRAP
jgi:hypothetical protein